MGLALEGRRHFDRRGLWGKKPVGRGGIISPLYPWRYHPAVSTWPSGRNSSTPTWRNRLRRKVASPELNHHGLLILSVDDEDEAVQWGEDNRRLRRVEREEIISQSPA